MLKFGTTSFFVGSPLGCGVSTFGLVGSATDAAFSCDGFAMSASGAGFGGAFGVASEVFARAAGASFAGVGTAGDGLDIGLGSSGFGLAALAVAVFGASAPLAAAGCCAALATGAF